MERSSILTHTYSQRWFELFGNAIDRSQTMREIEFLKRILPVQSFHKVLDACCGSGRHAHGLSSAGYTVTGVDANSNAVAMARKGDSNAVFVVGDLRSLQSLPCDFDAVICMWQSFGHFDDETNRRAMQGMADRIRPGGRIVLDVYQREFFESNQGTREFERNNTRISETKRVRNGRLSVDLVYADGGSDHFEWRLYWEQEWRDMLNLCRLEVFALCSEFNEHQAPRATIPRLQLVATKLHRNR